MSNITTKWPQLCFFLIWESEIAAAVITCWPRDWLALCRPCGLELVGLQNRFVIVTSNIAKTSFNSTAEKNVCVKCHEGHMN